MRNQSLSAARAKGCPPGCAPKSPLATRKELDEGLLNRLSQLFGVLSSKTRIKILHALVRNGELHVQRIADQLGMKIAGISNQLRLMAMLGIVGSRQEGLKVYYFMVDPCVPQILDTGTCLAIDSMKRRSKEGPA